jgi:ATP-binding cassette subfamily B protein
MVDYMSTLLMSRDAVKEVKLFQLSDFLLSRMQEATREFLKELTQSGFSQERWNVLAGVLPVISNAGIWLYSATEALAQRISLGELALTFQVTENSRRAMDRLIFLSGHLSESTRYLTDLFNFLDLPASSLPGALKRPTHHAPMPNLHGPITFNNVCFRYPGTSPDVLKGVSFTINAGERVALVGENGAGKTTLIKLLSRLYDPIEGAITCNGVDLREIEPEAYHARIGAVFQDFAQFDLTARENIGFGDIASFRNTEDLDQRVRRAAEQGGAASLIDSLPQQYDTVLGRQFENGTDLSGGQWQKIALARAFMRDADLLILDEPTAALDAFAEAEVYARFAELTAGKTTVFVTHRLSSVRMADRILVLKDGALVECGNHEELISLNGEYAAMYRLQAERYQ